MKTKLLGKIYDDAFVPVLISSLISVGCIMYNRGKSDCMAEIIKLNRSVIDETVKSFKQI